MRISDGGGYGAITGNTYHIKTMAVTPESASGYSASRDRGAVLHPGPGAVRRRAARTPQASQTLADIADSLVQHAQVLTRTGADGRAVGDGSFQQLHQTAVGLSQASAQTGAVLTWLGETILPFYKNYKAPGNGIVGDVESLFGDNPQDKAAQAVMERLNNRLAQANATSRPA